jgi:hypothetical protein
MFVAAGEPGNVKKVQASVATARKVFRIMRVSSAAWAVARNICLTATCVELLNAWSWHAFTLPLHLCVTRRLQKPHAPASLQPLEVLNPILQNPGLGGKPLWAEVLLKLRPILMSIYFGADHVVWAQQVGAAKLMVHQKLLGTAGAAGCSRLEQPPGAAGAVGGRRDFNLTSQISPAHGVAHVECFQC